MKKKTESKLTETIQIRLTVQEKNRIKGLADLYAGGNLSLWLIHAGLNAPREFLVPKSGITKTRRIKRV